MMKSKGYIVIVVLTLALLLLFAPALVARSFFDLPQLGALVSVELQPPDPIVPPDPVFPPDPVVPRLHRASDSAP